MKPTAHFTDGATRNADAAQVGAEVTPGGAHVGRMEAVRCVHLCAVHTPAHAHLPAPEERQNGLWTPRAAPPDGTQRGIPPALMAGQSPVVRAQGR